jgi:cytochrome d ubiquinol oxidase subunit I
MFMSVLMLSRLQFALTITFHIIFPAFSIGLVTYLVIIEALWLRTGKKVYYRTLRYLSKILALTFGMGIVSGLAMAFQMGSNWAGFSELVGSVLGVLFTLESLTAFFVEAAFLGILLLGWRLVSKPVHFLSTIMVCLGVTLSAFWIMSANSWMHSPAGILFVNNQFTVLNWFDVIFNPMLPSRFIHMLLASYIATLMMVLMISAVNLIKKRYHEFAFVNFKLSIALMSILLPLQIIVGDWVGLNVKRYQPVKTAAIEALWHSQNGANLVLAAKINQSKRTNEFELALPKLASLINTHQLDGHLQGLETVPDEELPKVSIVFWSFRIMVGLGLLMLTTSWFGLYHSFKKIAAYPMWLLKTFVLTSPAGFVALITGWFTSEVGRQPWVVYGLVKTNEVVSNISQESVYKGFAVIIIIYGLIFGVGYLSFLKRLISKGPIIGRGLKGSRKYV